MINYLHSTSRMESSTSFPERSFADDARTSAEFFAYMMTIRPGIPSDNTTKEFMVQSSPRNIRPKEKETKPRNPDCYLEGGQRRAASSTYRRCVSAQNGSNGWPRKHPISMEMFDNVNNETMWMNITYERWFILAGVCRIETLQQECKGIVNAVLARCGDELDKGLAYKHGPDDSKPHFSALLPKCLTRSSSNRRKSIVLSIVDDQSGGSH
ncbi:hypothetical protein BFJ70_g3051 [Fusarium oxysporum]|nr:hypothetical protein BFJ70_g3051 [Fusarium oxysporum]